VFGFNTLMIHSKLLDSENNNNLISSENLYKGACVKIKNSNKTFQVIGLNIIAKIELKLFEDILKVSFFINPHL